MEAEIGAVAERKYNCIILSLLFGMICIGHGAWAQTVAEAWEKDTEEETRKSKENDTGNTEERRDSEQDTEAVDASKQKNGEDGGEVEPSGLIPPKLTEYVSAEYPAAALAEGLTAEVKANIDIDERGAVSAVEIVAPAGHGFDEAAKTAMEAFVFEPAIKDGVPIPSRVLYVYRFELQADETAASADEGPEAPLTASLMGVVKDMEEAPLEGAFVTLTWIDAGDTETEEVEPSALKQTTDASGAFRFADLAEGRYALEIFAPGYLLLEGEEELVGGEERELIYRLESEIAMYETVVRGERPTREVTRREITAKEINKIPGTSGDALRAVQNMPGVARPMFTGGELIVRGSAPEDTKAYFDGMGTPLVYHFGGLTSVINSDLIKQIDFYPGNFSVRYGKSMGGVIDVETRAPAKDRLHAYIDADIWDAGMLIEGPVNKNWSLALSARRSYVDAVLSQMDFGDMSMTTAPRYYDFQLLADYHPDSKDHLKLMLYGTDDRMVMIWEDDDEPYWGSGLDMHLMTYQAQAEWTHKFNDVVQNQARLGFGYWGGQYNEGIMDQDWNMFPLLVRDELTLNTGRFTTVRLGVDNMFQWGIVKMKVPADYGGEGETVKSWSQDYFLTFDKTEFDYEVGMYGELELTVIPKVEMILGFRTDYFSQVNKWGFDPRFSLRYELLPKTAIKGGVGLFHQPPDMAQGDPDYGNPDLDLPYAVHYSVGLEQKILDNMELSLEGFYKDMRKLVRMSDELVERDGVLKPERFDNDGKGRVYGLEAQFKHKPTERFFGWITYTLMKSERFDHSGAKARPFDYDQTHILTAVGSVHLGWGVDVGLRFRLTTGNPYTPVVGASYDAAADEFVPAYGETNSGRMPIFHQLDLRIDKKWQWKYLAFTSYLDVQNVYFAKNTEFYVHSYDYSQRGKVTGLPIMPSIGMKLEY